MSENESVFIIMIKTCEDYEILYPELDSRFPVLDCCCRNRREAINIMHLDARECREELSASSSPLLEISKGKYIVTVKGRAIVSYHLHEVHLCTVK